MLLIYWISVFKNIFRNTLSLKVAIVTTGLISGAEVVWISEFVNFLEYLLDFHASLNFQLMFDWTSFSIFSNTWCTGGLSKSWSLHNFPDLLTLFACVSPSCTSYFHIKFCKLWHQVIAEGGESLAAKSGLAYDKYNATTHARMWQLKGRISFSYVGICLRKVSRNHARTQVIVTESGTTW